MAWYQMILVRLVWVFFFFSSVVEGGVRPQRFGLLFCRRTRVLHEVLHQSTLDVGEPLSPTCENMNSPFTPELPALGAGAHLCVRSGRLQAAEVHR